MQSNIQGNGFWRLPFFKCKLDEMCEVRFIAVNQDPFPKQSWDLPGTSILPTGSVGKDSPSPPVSHCAPRIQEFFRHSQPCMVMEIQPRFNWSMSLRRLCAKILEDHVFTCRRRKDSHLPTPQRTRLPPNSEFPYSRWGIRRMEEWLSSSLTLPLVCCCQLDLWAQSTEWSASLRSISPGRR